VWIGCGGGPGQSSSGRAGGLAGPPRQPSCHSNRPGADNQYNRAVAARVTVLLAPPGQPLTAVCSCLRVKFWRVCWCLSVCPGTCRRWCWLIFAVTCSKRFASRHPVFLHTVIRALNLYPSSTRIFHYSQALNHPRESEREERGEGEGGEAGQQHNFSRDALAQFSHPLCRPTNTLACASTSTLINGTRKHLVHLVIAMNATNSAVLSNLRSHLIAKHHWRTFII